MEVTTVEHAFRVSVQDQSHTAEARRNAMQLATELAFDEAQAGNVGVVVTEAARNLLKHAGGGELVVRALQANGSAAVEMLAIDKGPGIADIGRSFQDGFSTSGTPGTGLGAIARLSTFHDIYSQASKGTALLAQIMRRNGSGHQSPKPAARFRYGAVSLAMHGETVCGDAWSFLPLPRAGARLIVADGLGHGLLAADAARAAVRIHEEHAEESGVALLERMHAALRPTRGAAVAVAEIDRDRGTVRYTGVGNICGSIVDPDGRVQHLVSHSGTVGHEIRRIVEFTYPWRAGSMLVMHSDGLTSHWSLERYPGLAKRHPSLIAGVLFRDFSRGRDDATVVIVQEAEGA
jgi:anti-sigma regulatory factor (Ser/Thr protein kinase)